MGVLAHWAWRSVSPGSGSGPVVDVRGPVASGRGGMGKDTAWLIPSCLLAHNILQCGHWVCTSLGSQPPPGPALPRPGAGELTQGRCVQPEAPAWTAGGPAWIYGDCPSHSCWKVSDLVGVSSAISTVMKAWTLASTPWPTPPPPAPVSWGDHSNVRSRQETGYSPPTPKGTPGQQLLREHSVLKRKQDRGGGGG